MKKTNTLLFTAFLSFSAICTTMAEEIRQTFIVEELIEPYLIVQEGLASDDLAGAQVGAKTFQSLLKVDASGGPENLSMPIGSIINAKDIAAARAEFRKLTDPLVLLVEEVGIGGDQSVYLIRCPMAFNGKGAAWLQTNQEEIINPYYGDEMQKCGSVVKQIAGKATDSVEQ